MENMMGRGGYNDKSIELGGSCSYSKLRYVDVALKEFICKGMANLNQRQRRRPFKMVKTRRSVTLKTVKTTELLDFCNAEVANGTV